MSGNDNVQYTLTLDVERFDQSINSATKKIDTLDKSLTKTGATVEGLERSLQQLLGDISNLSGKFGMLDKNLGAALANMGNLNSTTRNTKRNTDALGSSIDRSGQKARKAGMQIENLADYTNKYQKQLNKLNPLVEKTTKGQAILATQAKETGKAIEKQSNRTMQANASALKSEIDTNRKLLQERKDMARELGRVEKRAEVQQAVAQKLFNGTFFGKNRNSQSEKAMSMRADIEAARQEADAARALRERINSTIRDIEYQNKALADGVLFIEKQIAATNELARVRQRAAEAERERARQAEVEANNRRVTNSAPLVQPSYRTQNNGRSYEAWWTAQIAGIDKLTAKEQEANRKAVDAHKKAIEDKKRDDAAYVDWWTQQMSKMDAALEKRGMRQQSVRNRQSFFDVDPNKERVSERSKAGMGYADWWVNSLAQRERAEDAASKRQLAAIRQAEREQDQAARKRMQQLRDEQRALDMQHKAQMQMVRDLTAMYMGFKLNQGSMSAVDKMSQYEQAQSRLGLWNLPKDQEQRFLDKSSELARLEKYLSNAEATQARLDAMAAVGYNNEGIIDKTLRSAARNVHIMRSAGYENADQSDLMKNLYGFAEARQVMYNPEEVVKSFDVLRRLSTVSSGKIKVADMETIARNIGDLRQTISAEGWLSIGALAEQFKTAGGGNGGGGGVATVGTMMKMMALYGSGRTITNRAAEQLLGADLLNVYDGDAAAAYGKNAAASKQFQKMIKNAGFKDIQSMSEDPVRFFAGMRGQIIDYMMAGKNFQTFFGQGAKRHTYDDKGQMVNAQGQTVDKDTQEKIEGAAIKRYLATLGVSNKAVDGLALMMNKSFIERAQKVRDSALNAESEDEAIKRLQDTFKGATENLHASLVKLAEAFMPLLPYITGMVNGLTSLITTLAQFTGENPAAGALIAIGTVGSGVALTIFGLIGKFNLLKAAMGLIAGKGTAVASAVGAVSGPATAAATALGALGNQGASSLTTVANTAAGTATKSKSAFGTIASSIASTGSNFLGLSKYAGVASTGVKGAVAKMLISLGTMVTWAGWLSLAGMFGWVVGKWISSIEIGGLTISERMQNLYVNIETGWKNMILSIRAAWNNFLSYFGATNQQVMNDIRQQQKNVQDYKDGMLLKAPNERANKATQDWAKQNQARFAGKKAGDKVKLSNGKEYVLTAADEKNIAQLGHHVSKLTNSWDDLTKDKYLKAPVFAATPLGKELIGGYNNALKGAVKPADRSGTYDLQETPKIDNGGAFTGTTPTPTSLANGYAGTPQIGDMNGTKEKKPPKDRNWNNAFYADMQDIRTRLANKSLETDEALTGEPNYDEMAKNEFMRRWSSGQYDDDNDPRSRKFTKGAYNKETGWLTSQIDWAGKDASGASVQDWLQTYAQLLKQEDLKKGIQFAAERVSSTNESVLDALENYGTDPAANSSAATALDRQFARQESKTPVIRDDQDYQNKKRDAITNQAVADFAEYATQTKALNEDLQIELLDSESERQKASADLAYKNEIKKAEAIKQALSKQIDAYEDAGQTETEVYKRAKETMQKMEQDFTIHLQLQNEKRLRAQETAWQQTLRGYRDLQSNMNAITDQWGQKATDTLAELISGKQDFADLDWGQIGGDLFADLSGVMTKKVIGEMSTQVMGGSGIFDMAKALWDGQAVENGGMLGDWLNKLRGLQSLGNDTAEMTAEQANTAAVTNNTMAITNLTAAINSAMPGGAIGDAMVPPVTSSMGQAAYAPYALGYHDTGMTPSSAGVMYGTGGYLDSMFGTTENDGLDYATPGFMAASDAGGYMGISPDEMGSLAQETGGLLSTFNQALSPLTTSVGQLWNSVSTASQSLWSFAGDAVVGATNALVGLIMGLSGGGGGGASGFFGVLSSVASVAGSLYGAGVFGGGGAAAAGAGSSGMFSGGSMEAGGMFVDLTVNKNGNAFTGSGIHAFAKGGAFTNGVFDSPTFFKFANGGSFGSLGVMGEAGPEAVMPLTRDSSGRLGVSVPGGLGEGGGNLSQQNVSINITVNQDGTGSTSQQGSGADQQWKQMANNIRAIVVQELATQSKPGGMNYKK